MTANRDFKFLVRARQQKTGESYLTASRHVRAQRKTAKSLRSTSTAAHTAPPDVNATGATPPDPAAQITNIHRPSWTPTRVRLFKTPDEAKAARPALNDRAVLAIADFEELTGICEFPKKHRVTCQLEVDEHICDQEFGNGWTMRCSDNTEGFIGKDCAKRHFGADRKFARETARARHEVTVDDLIARIKTQLDNPQTRPRILATLQKQRLLVDQISHIRGAFPYPLVERLRVMAAGNIRTISVEFEHREEIEDAEGRVREISKWYPSEIASIAAPHALNLRGLTKIGDHLREAYAFTRSADATPNRPVKDLRRWCTSLEGIGTCEKALEQAAEALTAFSDHKNLPNLVWCCRQTDDQFHAAYAVLKLQGVLPMTNQKARVALDGWRKEVMARHGNINFRVP